MRRYTRPRESGRAERLLRALSWIAFKKKKRTENAKQEDKDLFDTFRVKYG